jgi:hypothetical protein
LVLAASFSIEGRALAYCRTTTCGPPQGSDCTPLEIEEGETPEKICKAGRERLPIAWKSSCVSFSLDTTNLRPAQVDPMLALVTDAFAAWTAPDCPGEPEPPSIAVSHFWGAVACGHAEYNKYGGNANSITFLKEWPLEYHEPEIEFARTTTTFLPTGEIVDSDIEVNDHHGFIDSPEGAGDDGDRPDLNWVLTHEIGHFFGFNHSVADGSVLIANYVAGAISRTLAPDDRDGMCAVYPPGRATTVCDFAPQRGFSPECGLNPATGGFCTIQPQRLPGGALDPALVSGALGALAAWRRRRQRR